LKAGLNLYFQGKVEKDVYASVQMRKMITPYHPGDRREGRPFGALCFQAGAQLVSLFGFSSCLACLYLAMRGIMRLGGMVASGGPYAIAHPAPGWVWIVPVSILAGLAFIGLNFFASRRVGGIDILALAWPALFLSLGWNFLEFAFKPLGGHGLVWGWLVCGVVFVIMGIIPFFFVVRNVVDVLFGRKNARALIEGGGPDRERARSRSGQAGRAVFLLLQLAAIGLGIFAATRFFLRI
jgi:hypothetical protein